MWGHLSALLAYPQHAREFTPAELQRVAEGCGLRLVSLKVIESWGLGRIPGCARTPTLPVIDRGDRLVAVFAHD